MKNYRYLSLIILCVSLFFGTAAQKDCSKKDKSMETDQPANGNNSQAPVGEIKSIANGSYSQVEESFIFIVRSKETYAQLQATVKNLPPASEIDFSRNAVVAAFAGTKRTGGYSVAIKNTGGKISVEVIKPPKGAIVTEALTTPFNVALVPVEEGNPLTIEPSANWKNAMQTYRITSAEFENSGGITGRGEKFSAEGTIGVWQTGDLVTLAFNLSGKGAKSNMKLSEMASGVVRNGKIELARLDAGSFAENPKPPLKVTGMMSNNELTLSFEPLPTNVADGFQVRGQLKAAKTK